MKEYFEPEMMVSHFSEEVAMDVSSPSIFPFPTESDNEIEDMWGEE